MEEWAASNRSGRNFCLLIHLYVHLMSCPVYTKLSPLDISSPSPSHLSGQPLTHLSLPFRCHSCLLGGWEDGMCGHQRALRVGINGM